MLLAKNLQKYAKSQCKRLEVGQIKEKLNILDYQIMENECMILHHSKSLLESKTLQDSTLFMPEYQVKNKNLILTDKLKNYKRAIQNTNYLKTLEAVSTTKGKALRPFWNKFTQEMSDRLWSCTRTDFVGSRWTSWKASSNRLTQNSWFTVNEMTVSTKKNCLKTYSPLQRFLWQDIMEGDQLKIEKDERLQAFRLEQKELHNLMKNKKRKGSDLTPIPTKKLKIFDICTNTIASRSIPSVAAAPKDFTSFKYFLKRKYLDCQTLKQWLGAKRWVYNKCVNLIQKQDYKFAGITMKTLRSLFVNNSVYEVDNTWMLTIPYEIRDDGMRDFMKALKNEKLKKKKNYYYKYSFSFQSRNQKSQSVSIRARDYNKKSGLFKFLKNIPAHQSLPSMIDNTLRLQMTNDRKMYFNILRELDIKSDNQTPKCSNYFDGIISLDPGVRTFMTGYIPGGTIVEWGNQDISKIIRLCKYMDKLVSRASKDSSKKRRNIQKAVKRLRARIRNLVDELHKSLAKWLCENFRVVLLPKFNVSYMVNKKTRKISSKTARSMMTWSHFRFRQRLISKAREYPWCKVIICDEAYTSKTCCCCGNIDWKLKGKKVYSCSKCKFIGGRDMNGAFCILLRYLSLTFDEATTLSIKSRWVLV